MDFYGILFDMKNGSKVPYSKNYFDTLLAAKLEELGVKTITGVLPLTFTTSETALRSWTIYGNDFQQEESKGTRLPLSFYTDEDKLRDWTIYGNNTQHNYSAEGTLPLTFSTHTAGAADAWTIYGNDDNGTENLYNPNATDVNNGYVNPGRLRPDGTISTTVTGIWVSEFIPVSPNIVYTLCDVVQTSSYGLCFYDNQKKYISGQAYSVEDHGNLTFTTPNATAFLRLTIKGGYDAMLVKGSTAPDHYIPYQKGVGQRTANLIDESDFSLLKVTPTAYRYGTIIGILPQGTYTLTATKAASAQYVYLTKKNNGTYTYEEITNAPYTFTTDGVSQYILRIADQAEYDSWAQFGYSKIMLVEGSAAPQAYIPFGYEIPLNVNSTTQDIYIGDSPLTEGQSISKTSTGVDIAAIAGSNTITTELYNKPSMSIEGVDYVGVGEYVNGQWQIPLTVSDGTNTTTVNIPIDAPLTAYDTATKTSTGVDIATADGTNTISTTLDNKPEMLVYYGYKGVGEHSGDTWELYFITSANGNQQLTKITMNKPLRAGETLTSEQAGVTIPTYADAENTLSLYPSAAGYGNPEVSITYKGG